MIGKLFYFLITSMNEGSTRASQQRPTTKEKKKAKDRTVVSLRILGRWEKVCVYIVISMGFPVVRGQGAKETGSTLDVLIDKDILTDKIYDKRSNLLESAGDGGFKVSGEQQSLGEGDLSRLVTGSRCKLAGP